MSPFRRRAAFWPGPLAVVLATVLAIVLLCGPVPSVQSQTTGSPTTGGPEAENLARWEYEFPLERPADDAKLWDFLLTPQVFDVARTDLGDLRLFDSSGREVPYALRIRSDRPQIAHLEGRLFNTVERDDGARQVSVDLGDLRREHSQLQVGLTGTNFARDVLVEGSDDGDDWRRLATERLVSILTQFEPLIGSKVSYPPSRFRYLRVTVAPDANLGDDEFTITSVDVYHRITEPGEPITRAPANYFSSNYRSGNTFGTTWEVDLGGQNTPVHTLIVTTDETNFTRNFELWSARRSHQAHSDQRLATGTWRRVDEQAPNELIIKFEEARAAVLRLNIRDDRNPPLTVESIVYQQDARQVVFSAEHAAAGPMSLLVGNPNAQAPRYDFSGVLPPQPDPPPQRLELGPRKQRPEFEPPPPPLTERAPGLIYGVLIAGLLVLAAVVLDLARELIRRHDHEVDAAKADDARTPPAE